MDIDKIISFYEKHQMRFLLLNLVLFIAVYYLNAHDIFVYMFIFFAMMCFFLSAWIFIIYMIMKFRDK